MKKIIKKSIVLALLFTALQGSANVNPTLQNLKDGKTTVLTLSDVEEGDMLYIKDVFGKVLYENSISTSGEFVRGFNLTTFHKGSYYFEFNNNIEVKRVSFRVVNHKIVFKDNNDSVTKREAKRIRKNQIREAKRSSAKKPVEIEKGVQRRILSFKGQDFANYNK